MSEFISHKLEYICHNITDGKHGDCKNEDNSGCYFVSSKDVYDGKVHLERARQITKKDYLDTHKRTKLEKGDILITNSGSIGRMAYMKDLKGNITFQKSVAIIKPDKKKVNSEFLYYYLLANTNKLIDTAGGTAQKNLLLSDMRQFDVQIPLREAQEKITKVIVTYDNLIENNDRRIAILEEMAQRLYREWFVHFRFPGHENVTMVHTTDLGIVPDSWAFEELKNIACIVMGQSPSSEYYNESGLGLPFHQGVSHYGNIIPEHKVFCSHPNRVAEADDILFSVRAPVGKINLADRQLCLGRGLSAIRSTKNAQAFLYFSLKHQFKTLDSIGSGSIFNSVTKKDMEQILVLVPDKTILTQFEKIVLPIIETLKKLTIKNRNLRKTRDILLPRLISGDIDVSKIDIAVEDVNK